MTRSRVRVRIRVRVRRCKGKPFTHERTQTHTKKHTARARVLMMQSILIPLGLSMIVQAGSQTARQSYVRTVIQQQ